MKENVINKHTYITFIIQLFHIFNLNIIQILGIMNKLQAVLKKQGRSQLWLASRFVFSIWSIATPEMLIELQLPFDKEYEMAKMMK